MIFLSLIFRELKLDSSTMNKSQCEKKKRPKRKDEEIGEKKLREVRTLNKGRVKELTGVVSKKILLRLEF